MDPPRQDVDDMPQSRDGAGLPPYVERLHARNARRTVIWTAGAGAAALAWGIAESMKVRGAGWLLGVAAVSGLVAAAMPVALVIALGRLQRRARGANWRLCTVCGYDMGQATGGTCPECGSAFDATRARRAWHTGVHVPGAKSEE